MNATEQRRRSRRSCSRRSSQHREAGETLIELLITIMLLGLAVVTMVGGLLVLTASSVFYQDETQVQNGLYDWASTVAAMPYTACVTAGAVPGPPDLPAKYTATVTSVEYWNGSAFTATCPSPDTGVARLGLRIGAPLAGYPEFSKSLEVVIRKPCVSGC